MARLRIEVQTVLEMIHGETSHMLVEANVYWTVHHCNS